MWQKKFQKEKKKENNHDKGPIHFNARKNLKVENVGISYIVNKI